MKSQALQELITNIFNDEKTRQEFRDNPESVVSKYSLSKQEKTAVLKTHAKLGLATADSQQLISAFDPFIMWI